MIKKYIAILFVILSFSVFAQKDTSIITILHLNDLHAKINRFPQLKHVVDSIKNIRQEVLLVSSGDLFSGNPIVDRYEERGWPMIDLMNDLQFDLTAIGNHEFDYGQNVLNERMKQAHFPFVCANIRTASADMNQPSDYYIYKSKFSDTQIAFVSLLQVGINGIPDSHPKNLDGLQFLNPEKEIKLYKKQFKSYTVKIALTHLGKERDEALAKDNQWLDLILGGHSHSLIQPAEKIGKVLVCQAGSNVKYVGITDLTLVGEKLLSISDTIIPLKYQPKDSTIYQKVKAFSKNPALQEPIANLTYGIETPEEIGKLMADAYREGLGADIAFQNIGGVRLKYLKEGPVKLIDLMFLDPFNNEILLFDMNKKDILSFLRYAYSVRNEQNQLISGITADFKTNKKGELIDIILKDKNGVPLSENKIYKVAINSYMANSYRFSAKDKAQLTGQYSNDLILLYLKKYFPLNH